MRALNSLLLTVFGLCALIAFNNCSSSSSSSGSAPPVASEASPTPTPSATPTSSSVVQKGSRVLAMDTNDSSADFSFSQSFAAAQSVGVSAGTFHLDWNTDESGANPGTYTDANGSLGDVNGFYPSTSPPSAVSLTVAPIDTAGPELPSDLTGLTMDNSAVITRFNSFMTWVLSKTPGTTFTSIQIGNEIDVTSQASGSAFWQQYKTFLTAVVAHIHAVKPGVKVGVTVTLYGLTGQGTNGVTAQNGILSLLSVVDVLGLTYYPLDANFMAKDPTVVATDIAKVFQLVSSNPIYFQEVGYPTSSTCGGSAANQAAFVEKIFTAWDTYMSQMPFLSFVRMNDWSAAYASSQAVGYGLGSNAPFVAYLETLGFRTYAAPSTDKAAWGELQNQTQLRGW